MRNTPTKNKISLLVIILLFKITTIWFQIRFRRFSLYVGYSHTGFIFWCFRGVSSPDSTQGLANMQMVPTCYRATEPWRCMVGYRLF
ncbi:hypothetical protein HMPREF1991_03244 [Hoylesella loescheii DSM 19665 = JCM 12249 = ATCC 15930]|uniref:Uncharacterized protein n=1 Tax=Hoylesella loescheii DSM 19665 = JCM 12249 = ATCC 15930 TaxID=1122985 RepID=A0A069QFE5_HOYLO|nr:hypothetical protein HMPREF1991_03244 [Hoylesella loescheii DSM 19665 = JCM 12249 = ATCC 15930]